MKAYLELFQVIVREWTFPLLEELVPELIHRLLRDRVEPPLLVRLPFGDSLGVASAFVEEDSVLVLKLAELVELQGSRTRQSALEILLSRASARTDNLLRTIGGGGGAVAVAVAFCGAPPV